MKIYIVGAGCGGNTALSVDAVKAINSCEVLIGSDRLIKVFGRNKKVFCQYKAERIKEIIDGLDMDCVILMGGDTGFYSGTKKLLSCLDGYDVTVIPGISSIAYFASKLKMPWEDWKLLSLHGSKRNIIGNVKENNRTFALLNNGEDITSLCERLIYYGMDNVRIYIGENLSYENEKITWGRPSELVNTKFGRLTVCLIINDGAKTFTGEINDNEFIRGQVPMTKSEIRTVSISKLGLTKESVLYDIGAGTGSVSITAALKIPDMKVFAIDKNPCAVKLIEQNKAKFGTDNIEIIQGEACQCIDAMDTPTHAFIGGSGGDLDNIVSKLKEKNENVRIVINTVTLESLCEAKKIIDKYSFEAEIIQLSVAKGEPTGSYTMMRAVNPVYIISF